MGIGLFGRGGSPAVKEGHRGHEDWSGRAAKRLLESVANFTCDKFSFCDSQQGQGQTRAWVGVGLDFLENSHWDDNVIPKERNHTVEGVEA
jgi:hypothetical protein